MQLTPDEISELVQENRRLKMEVINHKDINRTIRFQLKKKEDAAASIIKGLRKPTKATGIKHGMLDKKDLMLILQYWQDLIDKTVTLSFKQRLLFVFRPLYVISKQGIKLTKNVKYHTITFKEK